MINIILGAFTAFLSGIDLWCKSWVEDNMLKGEEKEICKNKIAVRKVHNKGFAMNLGDEKPEVVRNLSGIVCGIIAIYSLVVWIKDSSKLKKAGTVLALAGAISNTYDRFKRGYVVDYFGFKTKSEKFNKITFNLADVFIFVGAIFCLLAEIFRKEN